MNDQAAAATLETPADAGEPVNVKRWLIELALAHKEEENWRKESKRIVELYRNETEKAGMVEQAKRNSFNVLWSNTEILAPAIYNSEPRPDVRRRFRDADPVGKVVSQVLTRSLSYEVDDCGLHEQAELAVIDYLLVGRSVMRVRYEAEVYDNVKQSEKVYPELVHWDDFRRGPGKMWSEVPWIAFRHRFTREEGLKKLGEAWADVQLEEVEMDSNDGDGLPADAFKRGIVWEIWDKQKRQQIWVAPSLKDKPVKMVDDPLGLKDFYPIPEPVYSIKTTGTLIPVPEYCLYEDQAKELERITRRIQKLVEACKVRGVYNSVLSEFKKLLGESGDDNTLEPAENIAAIINSGGLDKNIWLMPIDTVANVLQQLYVQREQIKATLYEITGISDILRGSSSANETARAQEIKSQWGSLRLQKRQTAFAKFLRNVIRLMGEIIAEKFEPAQLAEMTGIQLMNAQEKAALQMQAQIASSQGQQVPKEMQDRLMQPTWEEVIQVLRSDSMRGYRIDIETDSTIQQQVIQEQKDITELLNGVVSFMSGVGPIVQSGAMPVDTAKSMLMAAIRRFRLGHEVEDAIEQIQAPQGPPPEIQQMQQQMQQAQQQLAGEKQQIEGAKQQLVEQAQAKGAQLMEREHKLALQEMQHDYERQLFDRDRKADELARGFEDRFAQMDKIGAQAEVSQREQSNKQMADALQKQAQDMQQFAAQVAESIQQLAQIIAQSSQENAQSIAQVAQAVEGISKFQQAPRRRVRGPDGRLAGVEVEGFGTVQVQ